MPAKDEAPRLFVVRLTSLIVASSVRLFFKDAMYSYMFFSANDGDILWN